MATETQKKPRTLGAGNVPDIGSADKPVLSPYGLPAYRNDGFWYFKGYSMSGSGEMTWARVTDPRSQEKYDALYPDKESITKAQAEAREFIKAQVTPKAEKPKAEVKEDRGRFEATKPSKTEAKAEPKPKFVLDKVAKQSDRALAIDRSLLAKQVVTVEDPRWLKHPNRFDVRGVDTPGSKRILPGVAYADRKAKRLSRKHHRGWKKVRFS